MSVAVLGGGSWGTTLANLLSKKGESTRLWVRNRALAGKMTEKRVNSTYLPGIELCRALQITPDIEEALEGADFFLVAVPSQFIRSVLEDHRELFPDQAAMICASKGVELETLKPMSHVIREALGPKQARYACLSGPSFADEVSRELPTAVSLGCEDRVLAHTLRDLFSTEYFRVYTSPDFRGVELGGAVKNIMAIAAGISDGLGFGHDARAALITRGLAEMSRLGRALGAQERTFMGLSGMGDLVLTCTGDLSRNRQVGLKLGQGQRLQKILEDMHMVAEGVKTTRAVYELGLEYDIELPITQQVHAMLYEDKNPREAVQELMGRALKDE
ncbi:MAG: NAD(P)-dependent glycerol-3-phosphate dehydrogenase [Desulfoplanes sp.]|nr:NAD(P)-dependent glycerol-3-phosphate dehydrogenase [Desulfoplanes sp.]